MRRQRRQHGLSLVEILVALAVFVIGILAVLRIFPRSLGLVTTVADRNQAVRLCEARINDLRQVEASLPDYILPAGRETSVAFNPTSPTDGTDPLNAAFGFLRLDDATAGLRPYDLDLPYRDTGDSPETLHRLLADQRLVVGEKAIVPRGMGFDSSGAVVSASAPYLTLFGPIQNDGGGLPELAVFRVFKRVDALDLKRTVVGTTSGNIYRDRPVFAVADGGYDDFTHAPAPDKLLFELDGTQDSGSGTVPRVFAVRLAYRDNAGVVRWEQLLPVVVAPTGYPSSTGLVQIDLKDRNGQSLTRVLPASVTVRQVLYPSPVTDAGRFGCDVSGYAHGVLRLPAGLAGETLSLEYVVDDWRTLKEVISARVGGDGKLQVTELQLSSRFLNQGFRPQPVVLTTGQKLDLVTELWDNDPSYAVSGKVPVDPDAAANLLPALAGTQDIAVYYRREDNWAVSASLAPSEYILEDDLADPTAYPVKSALVAAQRNAYADPDDSSRQYTDLLFRPSEAGRTVAVSYTVDVGLNNREQVAGELHVIPPRANRTVTVAGTPEPRMAIRLSRPNVSLTSGSSTRPLLQAIEGRSLQVRVAYDDRMLSHGAQPARTAPTAGLTYETAERLVELDWYVRR